MILDAPEQNLACLAVIIPVTEAAPEPDVFVRRLVELGFGSIVVVDDRGLPNRFSAGPGVEVIGHVVRRGRDAALKTGIEHALYRSPDLTGVLTVNSNGQCSPEEVLAVAQAHIGNPGALVVGETAGGAVTGMRAIPRAFVTELAGLSRPHFESDTLVAARQREMPWVRVAVSGSNSPGRSLAAGALTFCREFAAGRQRLLPVQQATKHAEPEPEQERTPFALKIFLWLLILGPVVVEFFGFRAGHLFSQDTWTPDGRQHFQTYVGFFLVAATILYLVARPWLVPVTIGGVICCSIFAVGIIPVAAVLFFVFALSILGRMVFGRTIDGGLAFAAGISIWMAAMYLTSRFPIHYAAIYLCVLAVPLLLCRGESRALAARWLAYLRPVRLDKTAEFLAVAGLAFLMIAYWLVVLKLENSADGITMHLAIPADIAIHHFYTFTYREMAWAIMPIGADFTYAGAYVLGGELAARLLNFCVLAAIALVMFQNMRQYVSRVVGIFLTALFLSSPLVYLVTSSMFVENFLTLLILSGVVSFCRFQQTRAINYLLLAALLFGTSMTIKVGAIPAAMIGLIGLLFEARWAKVRIAHMAATAALVLVLGLAPYVNAWRLTGNPFFPFANRFFYSKLVGNEMADGRFQEPLSWKTPVGLTFHTDRYHEGQKGSFGFQYILLFPLTIAGFFAIRSRSNRWTLGLGLTALLIVLKSQPNARYLYFTLPLLSLSAAPALEWLRSRNRASWRMIIALAAMAGLCNAWFMGSGDWSNKDFYSSPLFSASGRNDLRRTGNPALEIVDWINRNHPADPVAFLDGAQIAGIVAPVYENYWHGYPLWQEIRAAKTPFDVLRSLRSRGIQRLVVDSRNNNRAPSLTTVATLCTQEEFASGPATARKLAPNCEAILKQHQEPEKECTPGETLEPGYFDESDTRIRFYGKWHSWKLFPRTYNRTVTVSESPGDEACFNFKGRGFRYIYSAAYNRGIVEIRIDGKAAKTIDLYRRVIVWQAAEDVNALTDGLHKVVIHVLPQKNAASSAYDADVDAVVVY